MSKPIIGLTTYGIAHAEGYNLPGGYVQGVYRAGGVPLMLPPVGASPVDPWLEMIHGLVLVGGGDIDPASYGAGGHETVYNLDSVRDRCEFTLARRILESRLPTLAICRGMQVINVVLGGTLHVHLPDVFGEQVAHRKPPPDPTTRHAVEVAADALIADAMGSTQVDIVSLHHQALDRLGEGLRPVAWSADGVIEAVELDGHPNLLMVQWHPELSAADDPTQQALFDRLVELAGKP